MTKRGVEPVGGQQPIGEEENGPKSALLSSFLLFFAPLRLAASRFLLPSGRTMV